MRAAALLLGLCCGAAGAEPRYVSDELAVTLRKDRGPDAPVLGLVPAGMPVELLETHQPSGYARIRVDRREGWTLARHLSLEPAARARLPALQRQLDEKAKKLDQLQGELDLLRDENLRLTVERDEALQKLRRTSAQLVPGSGLTAEEMAADPQPAPSAELASLQRSVQELERRLATASAAPPPSAVDPALVGLLAAAGGLGLGALLALRSRRPAPRTWRDF